MWTYIELASRADAEERRRLFTHTAALHGGPPTQPIQERLAMTTTTKQRATARRRALLAALAALGLMTALAVPAAARNAGEEIPSRQRSSAGGEMNITWSKGGGSTGGRTAVGQPDAAGSDMAGRKPGASGGTGATA